jgi:antitoxin VapB
MPLNIKDKAVHDEARELARLTGESLTQAVRTAVHERLERIKRRRKKPLAERVQPIIDRFAARPVLDDRSEDEILGYDEKGLPS